MEHSFDVALATQHGINAAILFQNILFWINKNKANDKHFHDGRYWTYNSRKAFRELFPYMTDRQIWYALDLLVAAGMLVKGNYNTNGMDHTTWYALGDSGAEYANRYIPPIKYTNKSEVIKGDVPDYDELDRKRRQRNGEG